MNQLCFRAYHFPPRKRGILKNRSRFFSYKEKSIKERNFKMKEKANNDNRNFSKSNDDENNENGEEEEDNNKMKIINNINSIEIENQNKNIYKKIISNASLSRKGLNRPDEQMKINQDTLFKVKFGDINYSYYGVCDGHGPSGHFVSDFIKSNIAFIVYFIFNIIFTKIKLKSFFINITL